MKVFQSQLTLTLTCKRETHFLKIPIPTFKLQMADPLTALIEDSVIGPAWDSPLDPSDEEEHQGPLLCPEDANEDNKEREKILIAEDPLSKNSSDLTPANIITDEVCLGDPTPSKESGEARTNVSADADTQANVMKATTVKLEKITSGSITDQSYESYESKTPGKFNALHIVFQSLGPIDRSKMLSRVNTLTGQNEA
ncbi:hypothetical protein ACET3Z_008006 [Daucus carota]